MTPIEQRNIETQFYLSVFGTGLGQLSQRIAPERGIGNFVITQGGIEHAEAVMVAAGDDHVFLSGVGGQFHPFSGVEFYRVEQRDQFLVFEYGDFLPMHDPFSPPDERVQSPMNEHAKTSVLKPLQTFFGSLSDHHIFLNQNADTCNSPQVFAFYDHQGYSSPSQV